ncbi:MAG: hypothetical protein HYR56_11450 [Acidobacteria bacterium]|nr:hypothetical protein [Acidobacteriota bacterium]
MQPATVALSQIAHGLDLQAGDEVLITDQEHSGAQGGGDLRAKRYGIVVKKIPLAIPANDAEASVKSFAASKASPPPSRRARGPLKREL